MKRQNLYHVLGICVRVFVTSRSAMNLSLVKRAVPVLTRWSEEGNVDEMGLLMEITSSLA
jgi:hypothetical protein